MVKGMMRTIGCPHLAHENCQEDAVVTSLIRESGAIILVKGNVPISGGFGYHTTNPIYGDSLNPHNKIRSSGGSSGGEAGLVVSRCIPFGIGTDIAGSLRAPAHFCGLWTIKPTAKRESSFGVSCFSTDDDFSGSFDHIVVGTGPVARSVNDCIMACRVLFHP
mmetsp:Transcript_12341/g.8587  ORF Transcript_12341/g.8587 Transcript_12341/m.8587 type:complete len:163 (+) Transcript_12341:503-991(+)